MIIPIIRFNFLKSITLEERGQLRRFLISLFKKEGKRVTELQYIFCSDSYLLDINRRYLGHDFYTDIVTFDLSEKDQSINAEIYISVDRVRENARKYDSSLKKELHRVIFHGALHLCGYKDKTVQQTRIMRNMEEKYLELYGCST
ncbi:MAG TPA: rRNA maturation RNase YbeY [Puia sp.]|nr:rRNA maturation RNase YbeY [Puia sp.]